MSVRILHIMGNILSHAFSHLLSDESFLPSDFLPLLNVFVKLPLPES